LSLRQPHWVHVRWGDLIEDEKAKFKSLLDDDTDECPAEAFRYEWDGVEWLEYHVDFLGGESIEKHDTLREEFGPEGGEDSVRFYRGADTQCKYGHDPKVCRCRERIHHIGQDESVYKAYAREGKEWVIRGVRGLRKKTEGPGEMVSAFQDEIRGFGLPLSEGELAEVNRRRRKESLPTLGTTPGLRFLVPGKNKEGWWGYEKFEEQVVDVMDCFDVIAPNKQLVLEVDHSAGHAKFRENGLHVGSMNVKCGGKRRRSSATRS